MDTSYWVYFMPPAVIVTGWGINFLLSGIRSYRQRDRCVLNEACWRKRFRVWRVLNAEADITPVLKDMGYAWNTIQAPAGICGGLAILLVVLVYTVGALLSHGALLLNNAYMDMLWALIFLAILPGCACGYSIGFRHARRNARRGVTYGDLRRRRLTDYRSPLLRWVPGLIIFYNICLLFVMPHLLGPVSPLYAPERMVGVLLLLLLVTFLAAEVLMARVTLLPRLLITSDPVIAQHADDLLRATVIGRIQLGVLIEIGVSLCVQWQLLYQRFLSSPVLWLGLLFAFALWLACLVVLILATREGGRLGGAITGWPWRPTVMS